MNDRLLMRLLWFINQITGAVLLATGFTACIYRDGRFATYFLTVGAFIFWGSAKKRREIQ